MLSSRLRTGQTFIRGEAVGEEGDRSAEPQKVLSSWAKRRPAGFVAEAQNEENDIPDYALLGKALAPEPPFLKECRKAGVNLYVVTETVDCSTVLCCVIPAV
ncbi:hypothetical protein HPG69_011752 [Diceros bicornis minor]|uniref:Gasdermin pore forming domain-containing protein n=1 Tax=Diceros bicornis minor TaxID=77932 RepID=A0A7J7EHZ1_DICBM|nr:hypothetical protein HPG69_011752 [Diceros bicornis minor]